MLLFVRLPHREVGYSCVPDPGLPGPEVKAAWCERALPPTGSSWYGPPRGKPAAPFPPVMAPPALLPACPALQNPLQVPPPRYSHQGTAPCTGLQGSPACHLQLHSDAGGEDLLLPFWFEPNSEGTGPGSFQHPLRAAALRGPSLGAQAETLRGLTCHGKLAVLAAVTVCVRWVFSLHCRIKQTRPPPLVTMELSSSV